MAKPKAGTTPKPKLKARGAPPKPPVIKGPRRKPRFDVKHWYQEQAPLYGPLGDTFIEAHHRVPLGDLDGQRETKVSDLAAVCANCHRMLHRDRAMTVERLRALVAKNK